VTTANLPTSCRHWKNHHQLPVTISLFIQYNFGWEGIYLFISFIAISVLLLLIYPLYKAYQNTKDITVNHVTISSNTSQNKMLHILQISDMHLENISINSDELYKKLKNEKIDLIALTGDFLDRKRSIPKLIPYLQVFQKLNPTYGTYAVFGNHDYVLRNHNLDKLRKTLEEFEIKVLENENDILHVNGLPVNIIGVDDFSTNRSELKKSYTGLAPGYNLVLTHDPNIVLKMDDYHYDYLLSGHFHGGQIHWPKPYHLVKMGKLVRMNMVKGLQTYQNKTFYISEGLGQTGVNIRVGSRPEITFHHLNVQTEVNVKTQSAV
jgi:uncharacterized protein